MKNITNGAKLIGIVLIMLISLLFISGTVIQKHEYNSRESELTYGSDTIVNITDTIVIQDNIEHNFQMLLSDSILRKHYDKIILQHDSIIYTILGYWQPEPSIINSQIIFIDKTYYSFKPTTLQVNVLTSVTTQEIDLTNWKFGWQKCSLPLIQLCDINLDGKDDLFLLDNYGATGNIWYNIFLFNPETNLYFFSEEYTGLTTPSLTINKRYIQSYSRMGWCAEVLFYLTPNGLNAPTIQIWTENEPYNPPPHLAGIQCWKIIKVNKNHQLVEISRDTLHADLYDLQFKYEPDIEGY